MASMRSSLRPTALATALLVLITGAGLPPAVLGQSPGPSAPPSQGVDLRLPGDAALADDSRLGVSDAPPTHLTPVDTDAAIDDALATADALPDTTWEIDALAQTLEGDPVAAFRVVRDGIRLEPYPGILRGPQGTLAARAGNAWDRALLLRSLLDSMGIPARFAFGELDDATAGVLVGRALEPAPDPLPEAGALAATTLPLEALATRARRDHALLRAALDDAGVAIGDAPREDLVAETRPHAWVQVEQDGAWLDLDPSLPDAAVGHPLTEATMVSDVMPDDAYQAVTVELRVGHLADEGPTTQTVLSQRLTAAAAGDAEIFLYFTPEGGGGLLSGPSTDTLVPQLMVDREAQPGTPFSVAADGSGGFLGLGGGGPALTDVWLTITREAPGRAPLVTEMPIIDRVPDDMDPASVTLDALEPLAVTDTGPAALGGVRHLVVSTGGLSPREAAIGRAGALAFVGTDLLDAAAAAEQPLGELLWPIAVADEQVALASERLLVPALSEPGVVAPVIDRPRLSLFSVTPDPDSADRIATSIDLVADEVRTVTSEDADPADVARRRLWYGALDCPLETEALLQSAAWAEPDGITLASASLSMGLPLNVLDDVSALPSGSPRSLAAALGSGLVAVVPGDPSTATTWWTVDTADGSTRAIVAPGLGGAVAGRTGPAPGTHDVQGGWTPGGGSYVNSTESGVRWVINETTGATEGYIRDGRFYRYARRAPGARTCRGGNEYSTLLGCVSIPTALVIGGVTAVIIVWAVSRSIRALR
jgi:transglutaminase-like putative cysteine protease